MDTPLLSTKLFVPPARPGLVPRPRLMERMESALSTPFTLVSAPAGFGKTTILAQWVASKPSRPVSWVQLDEGDNDPVRFWDYLIAALKTLEAAAGETASAMLHSPQTYPTESVLTALINDITDVSRDFAVVLDDYHLIKSDAIHAGVAFLLEHLPPRMHLIVATRSDPPLPLPHLRGRGTVVEVGADDLRFTDEEAGRLLREMLGTQLSREQVVALNAHTEGWVVGLKMAALSIRGEKDIQSFISGFTGSQRYVMDYLVAEVLKRQTEDVRDFLLSTSVLERLTAPLCDFLTGGSGGRDMLIELDRANLFLVPLDDSRQWYRYHHLFAGLLRHQLEMNHGASEVTRLDQRASQWYADNGFPDDAVKHALAARDWERAMRLAYPQSEIKMKRGEWNTVFRWLQIIPEEMLRTHPRLYSRYANALITLGHTEQASSAVSYLEQSTQDDADLHGEVALFQMILARLRGDSAHVIEAGEKALELLSPDNLWLRARASFLLGYELDHRGSLDRSWDRLATALEMGRLTENYWIAAGAAAMMSHILLLRGRLRSSLEMARQSVDMA